MSEHMISLTDVLGTTAGLLGQKLPVEAGPDSFDLSPVMLGIDTETPIRTTVISQTAWGNLAYRNGDWKILFRKQSKWDGDKVELPEKLRLYNLAHDPSEKKDLINQEPKRIMAMRAELMALLKAGRSR
ncbi:hypothetical protein BVX99_02540 [bacterium F16]|nr:hypothetical protein BVX99_02540 [bacterium F16]